MPKDYGQIRLPVLPTIQVELHLAVRARDSPPVTEARVRSC